MAEASNFDIQLPDEKREEELRQEAMQIFNQWFPEGRQGREEALAVIQPILDDPFGRKQQQ